MNGRQAVFTEKTRAQAVQRGRISWASAGLGLLLACSAGRTEASAKAPIAAPRAAVPLIAEAWADASKASERQLFMLHRVSPTMARVFRAQNAEQYASFGCIDCHGLRRQLPRDFLPELYFENGRLTAFAEQPEIAEFMKSQVVPAMRAVMGGRNDGSETAVWGCNGCHAIGSDS